LSPPAVVAIAIPDDAIEASRTICRNSFIRIRLLIVVPKIPRQVPTTDPITDLKGEEEMFVQKSVNRSILYFTISRRKIFCGFRILV
jgi:hypothetical protein